VAGLYPEIVRHVQVYFWISNQPNIAGVWPVVLPDATGKINSWHESAHAVCKAATEEWIKVLSNQPASCYQVGMPTSQSVFEGKDVWPGQITNTEDLLAMAFKDRMIIDDNHELLKKIRGEI
jgi:hypothetical protein